MENLSNINKHAFIDFLEQEHVYQLLKEQYSNEHVELLRHVGGIEVHLEDDAPVGIKQ